MSGQATILEMMAAQESADQVRYAELLRRHDALTPAEMSELAGVISRLEVKAEEVETDLKAIKAADTLKLSRQKLSEANERWGETLRALTVLDEARAKFMQKWSQEYDEVYARKDREMGELITLRAEVDAAVRVVKAGANVLGLAAILQEPDEAAEERPKVMRAWVYPPAVEVASELELRRVELNDLIPGQVLSIHTQEAKGYPEGDCGWGKLLEVSETGIWIEDLERGESRTFGRRHILNKKIRDIWTLPDGASNQHVEKRPLAVKKHLVDFPIVETAREVDLHQVDLADVVVGELLMVVTDQTQAGGWVRLVKVNESTIHIQEVTGGNGFKLFRRHIDKAAIREVWRLPEGERGESGEAGASGEACEEQSAGDEVPAAVGESQE
jgi:hypothetical protein